jgi:hypothetical protein
MIFGPITACESASIATDITAWSTLVLTVVGVVTLVDLGIGRYRHRKTVDLQIGRRAFRARRTIREWLADPQLQGTDNLTYWVRRVVEGEKVVEELLEQMVDLAAEASGSVQAATREAYALFMRGATFANKHGHPSHPTGHTNPRDQALAALAEFKRAEERVSAAVPADLDAIER